MLNEIFVYDAVLNFYRFFQVNSHESKNVLVFCKRVGLFYAKLLLFRFCAFVLEHFVTSQISFSHFFLSLNYSFFVIYIKSIVRG